MEAGKKVTVLSSVTLMHIKIPHTVPIPLCSSFLNLQLWFMQPRYGSNLAEIHFCPSPFPPLLVLSFTLMRLEQLGGWERAETRGQEKECGGRRQGRKTEETETFLLKKSHEMMAEGGIPDPLSLHVCARKREQEKEERKTDYLLMLMSFFSQTMWVLYV